ncbi:hypothetical protein BX666DRAFT_1882607 [Dichotomocladium elegans]|nr:hypothetical protein BX666DRAFT_1882607 [Dichotomocladium elegans]
MATSKRNNTSMRTSGKILKRAYRPVPRSRIPSIRSSTRVQGLTSTLRSLQLCKDTSDDVVEAMSEDNFNDEEEGNVGNQRETAFSKYRFKLDESESDYSSESEADDDDSSCDSPTVNGRKQLHLARQSLPMQSLLPNGSPWVGQTVDSGAADMPRTTINMERRNTRKKNRSNLSTKEIKRIIDLVEFRGYTHKAAATLVGTSRQNMVQGKWWCPSV